MKKISYLAGTGASLLLPVLAFAQGSGTVNSIGSFLDLISKILNAIVPILLALAVVYFLWGVIEYMTAGDDDKKSHAKNKILYGIIALFVMVSVWGLVGILRGSFGYTGTETGGPGPAVPTVNNPGF